MVIPPLFASGVTRFRQIDPFTDLFAQIVPTCWLLKQADAPGAGGFPQQPQQQHFGDAILHQQLGRVAARQRNVEIVWISAFHPADYAKARVGP